MLLHKVQGEELFTFVADQPMQTSIVAKLFVTRNGMQPFAGT